MFPTNRGLKYIAKHAEREQEIRALELLHLQNLKKLVKVRNYLKEHKLSLDVLKEE